MEKEKQQFKAFVISKGLTTPNVIDEIYSSASIVRVKRNDDLVQIGETCRSFWFLLEGSVRAYTIDEHGKEFTTDFAFENQFFTSFRSFSLNVSTEETITAMESCTFLKFTKEAFLKLIHKHPLFKQLYDTLVYEGFMCMEKRSNLLQSATAVDKYLYLLEYENPKIMERVPMHFIASYLGMSPETFSRVRSKI